MIVVNSPDLQNTTQFACGDDWKSTRLLVAKHGVGFSMNDMEVLPGAEMTLEYSNHIEANYCISGSGEVVDVESGETYPIGPGTLYCLDKNDRHILRNVGDQPLRFVCVFTPALTGDETHNSDGGYEAPST